jgi:WD repeat-containing protein 7
MNSVPLVLPFTLSASITTQGGSSDPSCANILVGQASDIANVSCFVPYCLRSSLASPSPAQQLSSSDTLEGVALGCEDGTLYFLRQSRDCTSTPINIDQPPSSRPPSPTPVHLSSRSRSRPRTPIASLSPFSLPSSRARVVSGISDEQAQAPKNYVDFNEEPEKLKELLKGGIKDSTSTDRPSLSLDRIAAIEKQHTPSKGLASPSSSVRRGEAKSLLSATQSPTPSVVSLPFPTSHSAVSSPSHPPYQLSLEFHTFLPRSGPGNAVVGLHALVNGRYLICLQSQGYDNFLFIYSFFQSISL